MIRLALLLALAPTLAFAAPKRKPKPAPAPVAEAPAPAPAPPPAITMDTLMAKSEADVRTTLGEPQIARREAGGALWTYREEGCALFVYFKLEGREGLRVSGASAGPRRRGEPMPETNACIAIAAAS